MSIRKIKGDPTDFWLDFDWEDMSEEEKSLWSILGWDKDSWEEEDDPPSSDDKEWRELSSNEKEAATSLGYDKETWDEDDDED